jgi:hypothetical protein
MADYIGIALWAIMALLELADGVWILMGKEDNSISCLNKPGFEQYNVIRVRLVTALRKFVAATIFVTLIFVNENLRLIWFALGLGFLAVVILFILKRTWAKSS